MVSDNSKTDKSAKYIRQLERESKHARLPKTSSRRSSRRRSHESSSRLHGGGDSTRSLPTDGLAKKQHAETSGVSTTSSAASQDFTSPRKSRSRRRINNEAPDVYSTSRSSRINRRAEQQPARQATKSGSRKHNGKRRKVDEMMTASASRKLEDTPPSHSTSDSIDCNSSDEEHTTAVLTSGVVRATNSREIEKENTDKKKNKSRRKKSETANIRATENSSRNLRIVRLLSCITVMVLIVIGVVVYFVATRTSESRTPEASDPPTVRPSTSFPRTPNPSTSPPSSSPTLPFLFDPPLQEDCDRVRAGEVDLGQDPAEHSFDVILDVIMGIQFGQSETMDLLELEIQTLLMPKLIGCGEVRNRELTHQRMLRNNPYRYIVANAKIQWRPSSLEENADCSHPMCLSATFNMDLFLKTEDDDYFVIMNLVADVFGGNLVDSLNLQSLPFISVVVRSVINKNPTMAPSTLPSSIPSTSPSREPTEFPSRLPSLAPTATPTQRPTVSPTPGPSLRPTGAPTTRPPTAPPTPPPTRRPTPVPTQSPTAAPSKSPSALPSTSINPTGEMDGYFQQLDHPIRIACAGDSLTHGTFGGLPYSASYPFQLQEMLGGNFEVFNDGKNSVTAIRGLSFSYASTSQFQASLDVEPDIYLLMLGTNDSKYWGSHGHNYRNDMIWIANQVRSISTESSPRIIVAIPPWVKINEYGIRNDVLVNNVQPEIQTIVTLEDLQLVDMYSVTFNVADRFIGDGLHLNKNGYKSLASAWQKAILCNQNRICEVGENCISCPGDCYLNCSPTPTLPPTRFPSLLPTMNSSTAPSSEPQ